MFLIKQGNYLSALVVAGLLSVVVLPYFSEQDLLKEGVDVTGKFFAKYEDLLKSDNQHFIRPDLIFSEATVVLSEDKSSEFKVEHVYIPNPGEDTFKEQFESNTTILLSMKQFLWPLGAVLYRLKKGLMFAWGWCRERTSAWFLRRYFFKEAPADEIKFAEDMSSVCHSHYSLFQKYCPFLAQPLMDFCEKFDMKTLTPAPGFGNITVTFNFSSAQHFDEDFAWACGVWYNKLSATPKQLRDGLKPIQSGGHFFCPSLRCAFLLDADAVFLTWHSKRHLHGTTLFEHIGKTRIGTSMQLTKKHVHATFACMNKFAYKQEDCPVAMDYLI